MEQSVVVLVGIIRTEAFHCEEVRHNLQMTTCTCLVQQRVATIVPQTNACFAIFNEVPDDVQASSSTGTMQRCVVEPVLIVHIHAKACRQEDDGLQVSLRSGSAQCHGTVIILGKGIGEMHAR